MTQVSTRFPVLLAAFFAAASPAPAQVTAPQKASASASAPLPFDPAVTVGTLSNGMRYYIRENPKPEKRGFDREFFHRCQHAVRGAILRNRSIDQTRRPVQLALDGVRTCR